MPPPPVRLARRVAVGLSGGVDSSVAALLLLRQGYEVVGVHMTNWDATDEAGASACPESEDVKDAHEVSKQLGIPFHRVDFSRPYWTNVFTPFLEDYEKGWTPNPDVLCNREIKFDKFQRFAAEHLQASWVATGHYARLLHPPEAAASSFSSSTPPHLLAGVDAAKDQSYFLSHVPQDAFRHVLFPLGPYHKPQVRALAKDAGLCTAAKKESMGICFVGKRRIGDFLPAYLEPQAGTFVSVTDGQVLGKQEGVLTLLTVGQGAKIGGVEQKWFVCGKDMDKGVVYVAPGTHHPALYCDSLVVDAKAFNWIGAAPWELVEEEGVGGRAAWRGEYRVRYRQPLAGCTVTRLVDASSSSSSSSSSCLLRVDFDSPQRAVALKQTLALYAGERCMGGAPILACGPSYWEQGKELPEERVEWAVS